MGKCHIFRKAVEWEMVEESPFDRGKSLQLKENNQRIRYLTEEEISRLLKECEGKKHLYRIVVCALNSGMRRGEILGLTWSQIRNGFIYLEKTKTKNRREIPINDDLQELLGHRTMSMTTRYAHLSQGHKKKAVNLLNGLTARAENSPAYYVNSSDSY